MKKEEFKEQFNKFCKTINFPQSFLDADSIRFMNEFNGRLQSVIDYELEKVKKQNESK